MEVEDVIELGSSDDEAEPPAAKKIKPLPNAMVHIPSKIRDVTINPVSCHNNKLSRKLLSRAPNQIPIITMSRTNVNARQNKPNGRCLQKITPQSLSRNLMTDKPLHSENRLNSYPIKVIPFKQPKVGHCNSGGQRPRGQGISPKLISSLPPSITVTKTHGGSSSPIGMLKNKIRVNKDLANNIFGQSINNINPFSCLGEIPTVELDDDENTSSVDNSSPAQWYMRPEEQVEKNELEDENNSEPKAKDMIEITIEDSPVKPCPLEQAKNDSLSITIEDSPIKVINKSSNKADIGSDSEQVTPMSPNSKKKLEYPEAETSIKVSMEIDNENVIESEPKEIEDRDVIELADATKTKDKDGEINVDETVTSSADMEVNDTTQKDVSPKKDNLVENSNEVENKSNNKDTMHVSNESSGEFHSIFQEFMDLCLEIDKSEDMKTIIEKRIKTYSRQVPKEFVESELFLDMVSTKITLIKSESFKIYLHIKDIVDELKLHRTRKKTTPLLNENNPVEDVDDYYDKYSRKRRVQIRKLEKTLKKLERAINKLDEQEVDFDDEEDSVYLLNDRYKERFVRTYAKLCQLTDTKMLTEPRIVIECRPGQPPGPAKKLEKWINKKVPIGSTLPFPDFHDVMKCVREANNEDKLGWNEADIMDEARDLFTRCGKKLQRRRQENEWRLAASRITQGLDPAEKDESLKKKLDENKEKAYKKETELLNKYAQKQNQLHLEPTEIEEKDADNSPVESDDEIDDDSDLLDDSQKRRDRLQRLLDEKESRKINLSNTEQQGDNKNGPETESLLIESKENEVETIHEENQDIIDVEKSKQIDDKMEAEIDYEGRNLVEKINITTNVGCTSDVINADDFNKEQILLDDVEEIEDNEIVEEIDISPETAVVDLVSNINEEENIQLLCDDFYGDELNLLEKLNSGNETSSPDPSDLEDSPIAISDSFDSNSESENYETYDVISIGNSSCSETETNTVENNTNNSVQNKNTSQENNATVSENTVTCDLSNKIINKRNIEPDRRRTISVKDITPSEDESENILLAYSEDEEFSKCINLQDNSLTIGETMVGVAKKSDMSKDVEPYKCDEVISKDDKIISTTTQTNTIIETVRFENNENKQVEINNYSESIIRDRDDTITTSEKLVEESICSDVTNETGDNETNEKKSNKNSNDSPFLSKMSKKTNKDFSNTSNENKKMEIDSVLSENANDCDHNVPTTKETGEDMIRLEACNEQIPLEVREEATVPSSKILEGSGDPITPDVNREPKILDKSWESVLLEDNSETKTLEEIGETVTLESGRESTLNKSWETLLLEDSMEGETNKENGESKTPEERGEIMNQRTSEDQKKLAMNEEPITFDEDVEPVTVEVGEEPKSGEDDTDTMSPCTLEKPEPSTSGVNNNTD
ncbi:PREDICTED: uncharacterized protein LOC106117249 isoform X2 [Papilio xuthus]|uniref:Uncharacterized protein LOC106117249 isoform X2 n=1 Tax=Papilio xuthus TaxID=66420 RepID=A0AAJ6Z7P6_PAPXU|nr:PREDICTED: uncharacterized protein LOC106117249 isoform X2 [Papilio xuthus]